MITFKILESEQTIYLVMEYAKGGELFQYIVQRERLKEQVAARFLLQLIGAIDYLHQKKIIHRGKLTI
jgi:5'-AMP-activated protein kinase catalytic alpha subunit